MYRKFLGYRHLLSEGLILLSYWVPGLEVVVAVLSFSSWKFFPVCVSSSAHAISVELDYRVTEGLQFRFSMFLRLWLQYIRSW